MRNASDFRRIARDALRGRWALAVIAGLIASLLGAGGSIGPELNLQISENGAHVNVMFGGQQIYLSGQGWNPELTGLLLGGAVYLVLVGLVLAVLFFILSSVVGLGYAKFNLDYVDRRDAPQIGTMFAYFPYWKTAAVANLWQGLYVLLWSLLLVIPGVMAAYSYSMTGYILAEHPDLEPREAIARSKEMMSGNRWRLFCLHLSFIGWNLLNTLTLGIGSLWLNPYQQIASAAFYRDLSGTDRGRFQWVE